MNLDAEFAVILGINIFKFVGLDDTVAELYSFDDLFLILFLQRLVEGDLIDFLLVV